MMSAMNDRQAWNRSDRTNFRDKGHKGPDERIGRCELSLSLRIQRIANSPTDFDAESTDYLDLVR